MNIAYCGPLNDYSGYGEANRHDILALESAGVMVIGRPVSYVKDVADFGPIGELIAKVSQRTDDYKIKILHTTPDQYIRYIEPGKYHIGRFFWETDLVPDEFAAGLQIVDEIWTGSQANKQAIIKAGVTKPIHIFQQSIEIDRTWPDKYLIPGFPDDGFLFYSIFEWTDRKNPQALLKAYWSEFQGEKKVGLLIKTYFRDFSQSTRRKITEQIEKLKDKSGLQTFPPVYLYLELMDRYQVMRLHQTGDCFVSAHHGEGWGIPQVEAMLAGKPIISTNYGGVHEWLLNDFDAKLIDCEMVPVYGMEHSAKWYTRQQNWAEIDQAKLSQAMRQIFENKKDRQRIAKNGQEKVKEIFNPKLVGHLMATRLEEIERLL